MDSCVLILVLVLFALFVYVCCACRSSFSADSQNPVQILYNQPAQNRSGGPNPGWPIINPNPVENDLEVLPYHISSGVVPSIADIKIGQGTYPYNHQVPGGPPAVGLRETFEQAPALDAQFIHGSWPQEPFLALPTMDPISRDGDLNSGILGIYNRNYVNTHPFFGYNQNASKIPGTEGFTNKKKRTF